MTDNDMWFIGTMILLLANGALATGQYLRAHRAAKKYLEEKRKATPESD